MVFGINPERRSASLRNERSASPESPLQAYSGADLDIPENQKIAITQLLTDLMHYCETMSMGKRSDHPDFVDFE